MTTPRTKDNSEWRVSKRVSITPNCYYVDWVSDERWGKLELVAENLSLEAANKMANDHNALLDKDGCQFRYYPGWHQNYCCMKRKENAK